MKTVTVTFVPQAWVNNYAVEVDPQGPVSWEVPAAKVQGIEPDSYESDALRECDSAPEWVKEWSGPFYITWKDPKNFP